MSALAEFIVFWLFIAALLTALVVVSVVALVRVRRQRNAPPQGLLRAGGPEGTDDPKAAFDRAAGKAAWTRIGGGL